ncbi:MAG: hypothetical protein ACJ72D_29630 [Marmoricola sp.]
MSRGTEVQQEAVVGAPPARRFNPAGWRDPRLVLGVVLVAGCTVLGSVVLAAADDTVAVWAVRRDEPAGIRLERSDLVQRRVRLTGGGARRYLRVGGPDPAGRTLVREVGADELLPAAAMATSTEPSGVQVPLDLAVGDLPTTLEVGDRVDVWVVPREGEGGTTRAADAVARRLLEQVVVVVLPHGDDPLAPTSTRAVLLRVPAEADLAALLGATAAGRLVLTRPQGPAS